MHEMVSQYVATALLLCVPVVDTRTGHSPHIPVLLTENEHFYLSTGRVYLGCVPLHLSTGRVYVGCVPLHLSTGRVYVGCVPLHLSVGRVYVGCVPLHLSAGRVYVGCVPPGPILSDTSTMPPIVHPQRHLALDFGFPHREQSCDASQWMASWRLLFRYMRHLRATYTRLSSGKRHLLKRMWGETYGERDLGGCIWRDASLRKRLRKNMWERYLERGIEDEGDTWED